MPKLTPRFSRELTPLSQARLAMLIMLVVSEDLDGTHTYVSINDDAASVIETHIERLPADVDVLPFALLGIAATPGVTGNALTLDVATFATADEALTAYGERLDEPQRFYTLPTVFNLNAETATEAAAREIRHSVAFG